MPVELRKRKAPAQPAPPPPAKKAATKAKKTKSASPDKEPVAKTKARTAKTAKNDAAVNGKDSSAAPADDASTGPAKEGDTIDFEGFGGEVETHEGEKTTLKALVEASKAGVVIFTYPKASTPGCTTQACLFRDSYDALTAGGLAIYGMSADSPKANTTFKEKKNLPYTLLCDPKATLLSAIGLKKGAGKAARGVFVVDKAGKVLAAELGSPSVTLEVVKKIVADSGAGEAAEEEVKKAEKAEEKTDEKAKEKKADVDGEDEDKEGEEK